MNTSFAIICRITNLSFDTLSLHSLCAHCLIAAVLPIHFLWSKGTCTNCTLAVGASHLQASILLLIEYCWLHVMIYSQNSVCLWLYVFLEYKQRPTFDLGFCFYQRSLEVHTLLSPTSSKTQNITSVPKYDFFWHVCMIFFIAQTWTKRVVPLWFGSSLLRFISTKSSDLCKIFVSFCVTCEVANRICVTNYL